MNKVNNSSYLQASIYLVLYVIAGELSIQLGTINPGNMAIIWLASGIGLFAILQLQRLGIVVVLLGSLIVNTPHLFRGDWHPQMGKYCFQP